METDPDLCPVVRTLDVIGGRWKPTILWYLQDGPRGFNELRRLIPAITQRMLTLQLRALEADGVVARTVHDEHVPPRVDYALSRYGWTLWPVLEAMEVWGERHAGRAATFAAGPAPARRVGPRVDVRAMTPRH